MYPPAVEMLCIQLSGCRSSPDGQLPKIDLVGGRWGIKSHVLSTALDKVVSVAAVCEVAFS